MTQKEKKKKSVKEQIKSWGIALIIAAFIRAFFIELYMIPTSSMERSLMVGDFILVSKITYGARLPMIPLSLPLMHNRIPFTKTPSFLDWIVLPYKRLPGFKDVERYDPFVFNYPADDIRPNDPELGPMKYPSVKENYVKRCVAVAGDTLQIKNGILYINGKEAWKPKNLQYLYEVITTEPFNLEILKEYGYRDPLDPNTNFRIVEYPHKYWFFMTEEIVETFKKWKNVKSIRRVIRPDTLPDPEIYPHDIRNFPWNIDWFGPLVIPEKGMTIELNEKNLSLYRRCITAYEGHTLNIQNGKVLIDGKPATKYTFQMDYYFAMGDNRYNSLDSRFWGFVPEDHVVGAPVLVLFSKEGWNIRWNRIFKSPMTRE